MCPLNYKLQTIHTVHNTICVLQCVAVCCSMLQCEDATAATTNEFQILQCVAVHCSALQYVAVRCSACYHWRSSVATRHSCNSSNDERVSKRLFTRPINCRFSRDTDTCMCMYTKGYYYGDGSGSLSQVYRHTEMGFFV